MLPGYTDVISRERDAPPGYRLSSGGSVALPPAARPSNQEISKDSGRESTQALMPPIPIDSLPATPLTVAHGSSKT
jgi:hypothetical protein